MLEVIYKSKTYLKRVVLFLIIGTNFVFAQIEPVDPISPILHELIFKDRIIDLFPKMTSVYVYKVDGEYRLTAPLLNVNNKLRKFKRDSEVALIEGYFVIYERYDDFDLKPPLIVSYDYYSKLASKQKLKSLLRKEGAKKLNQSSSNNNYGSKAITLLSRDIAGTNLSLNIDGNISISGQLIFEDKDLVNLNSKDNKSLKSFDKEENKGYTVN